jgi:hypothetical protein
VAVPLDDLQQLHDVRVSECLQCKFLVLEQGASGIVLDGGQVYD